jgi:hypothetical protein
VKSWARRAARIAVVVAIVVGLVLSSNVKVALANDPAAALVLFKEGMAERDAGRYKEACDRFRRALALDEQVGTYLNLGECYERQRMFATAWLNYTTGADLAMKRKDPRQPLAQKEAARLEKSLSRLTIKVETATAPPNMVVKRNGVDVDPAAFNTSTPIDPGAQVIAVSAPDRKTWQTTVFVTESTNHTVRVPPLEALPNADKPQPPITPPPPNKEQSAVPLILMIGGGALLAAGLVFGGLSIAKYGNVTDTCPNKDGRPLCDNESDRSRVSNDVSTARTYAAISTIGIAAGVVAIGAGLFLHFTADKTSATAGVAFVH